MGKRVIFALLVLGMLIAGGMAATEAAVCGAYLHGLAGERLAARDSLYGLTPSDLPAAIAQELARVCRENL